MLYILMGQSCTGKSTVANEMKLRIQADVFSGKDYLRMAKNENEAWNIFYEKLIDASDSATNLIYLVAEVSDLDRLNQIPDSCKYKFNLDLDTIKSRFSSRMNGKLPIPVEKMLVSQFDQWSKITSLNNIDSSQPLDDIIKYIVKQ